MADLAYLLACLSPLTLVAVAWLSPVSGPWPVVAKTVVLVLAASGAIGALLGVVSAIIAAARGSRASHYALAAICVGLMNCAAVIVYGPWFTYRPTAHYRSCISNMKQLGLAGLMYAGDWDDRLPGTQGWVNALAPYHRDSRITRCPDEVEQSHTSYALLWRLARADPDGVVDRGNTILFFDCQPGVSPAGGSWLLPDEPRHNGGDNYVFADGHGKGLAREASGDLIWSPTFAKPSPGKTRKAAH